MKTTKIKNTILLNRSILKWGWYKDTNTSRLFIHLLLRVNYEDKPVNGVMVKRGQVMTSLDSLRYETGMTISSLRTCISKLIKTNEIASKSTNKHRIITVLKYNTYQLNSKPLDKQDSKPLAGKLAPNNKDNQLNQFNSLNISYSLVVKTWNNLELSKVMKITDKRKEHINARIEDYGFDKFIGGIKSIKDSNFLMKSKNTNWFNFDWLINPNNFIKLVEGNYHKEYTNYNVVGKNLLPQDIEVDWLDDYIKGVKESNNVSMGEKDRYCKAHGLNINKCPSDDIILKWLR